MAPLTIGLLLDWLDDDYASSIAFAFHDEVTSRGMRFVCFIGCGAGATESARAASASHQLPSARVLDGLVVASLGSEGSIREQRDVITRTRPLPACTLGLTFEGLPSVGVDNRTAVRNVVRHLVEAHGRRRVAFIRGAGGVLDAEQRYEGYVAGLEALGLSLEPALVASGGASRQAGREAIAELAARSASFDALVAANDALAAGALMELRQRGLRVPEDVALTGFDDGEDSRFADPPISSVRQPWRARARLAVDALLAERAGRKATSQVVAAEFVPRRSCGCSVSFEAPRARGRALELRVANWDWRKATALGLGRELALRGIRIDDEPARALVECYWEEAIGDRDGGFLLLLEQELSEKLRERASLSAWQSGLSRLRSDVLERLRGKPEALARAEGLVHAALERVSYATERQQALRRLEFERQGRLLALAGQATSTAFDLAGISAALRRQLPELGVPSFYVAQFEGGAEGAQIPGRSRLVIAHAGPSAPAPPVGVEFDTSELLPSACWAGMGAVGLVLEPLRFQGEALGYALFEIGPRQGAIYVALREQLSTALEGAALVKQVAQRALQREQAERARMQEELEIARRVQVSILPRTWRVQGLDVAAAMLPGQLPSADYFDIRPDEGGAWLAIGSARGGRLESALIIPMLQSIVASLCEGPTRLEPLELVRAALLVLRENVERRMRQRQHTNLLVARYDHGGRVRLAGDYEGIMGCPWHGSPSRPQVSLLGESPAGEPLIGADLQLAPHDLLLLYTQGLTRSSDFEDVPIGDERIGSELERNRASPVEKIRDDVLSTVQRWSGKRADLSVIVARRVGAG